MLRSVASVEAHIRPSPIHLYSGDVVSAERRRKERVPVQIPVAIVHKDESEEAQVANLSDGGFFLKTKLRLDVGSKATLQFVMRPDHAVCVAKGTIVWRGDFGVGVEFDSTNPAFETHVRKLEIVASNARAKQAWVDSVLSADVEIE